jgi:ribokinase
MSQIDVLSVGDIVTDAFIKLFDDQAHSYENDHGKWLAVPFGMKIPFDHVEILEAVGNAPNASVSFARLGLNSGLVSNVGGDQHGRDMINALHRHGVDTRFIRINPDKKSNYHYVLWYKEERTILIKHEDYEYHWPSLKPKELPRWVYFSSISESAIEYHDDLADWLEKHPDIKLAFQPGTFQIKVGAERLQRLYKRTEVVILNREEAVEVSGANYDDMHDLFNRMHSFGPRIVCITDGPDGAYASDGENRFRMPPYPDPAPPFERTGAGDAFASTFVAALMKGSNIEGALQWGPINSMNVVQHTGAREGLLTEKEIGNLLEKAPQWYKPERI